jgi:hypothetical protein
MEEDQGELVGFMLCLGRRSRSYLDVGLIWVAGRLIWAVYDEGRRTRMDAVVAYYCTCLFSRFGALINVSGMPAKTRLMVLSRKEM